MCEEELQKLLRHSQLYNSPTLKMSLVAVSIRGTPYGDLPRVDKTVDTFVPLTTLRSLGKLGTTRAKA